MYLTCGLIIGVSNLQTVVDERGLAEIAAACKVSPQAVHKWLKKVPAERVLELERVTGISRHQLRPDLYPEEKPRRRVEARAGTR